MKFLPSNSYSNFNSTSRESSQKFLVNFRPSLIQFLTRLSKIYTLGIFTAA